MPEILERRWPGDPTIPTGQLGRLGFAYQAYVPDRLATKNLLLPPAVAADLAAAGEALSDLQAGAAMPRLESVSKLLLRAEDLAVLGRASETVRAVAANVAALAVALRFAEGAAAFGVLSIVDIHRVLFRDGPDAHIAGLLRARQNWIGGDPESPRHAAFVPPPAKYVEALLDDLCCFIERTDLPPVLQAAIAHAQFETIHPFTDGNGRVGRALIQVVLRRRGATPCFVPPIELVLASDAPGYERALMSYRRGHAAEWVAYFAWAMVVASTRTRQLSGEIADLQAGWREAAGCPRDAAAEALIRTLPGRPILDAAAAEELTGAGSAATCAALEALQAAGILSPVNVEGRCARIWEAVGVVPLLDGFDWSGP